MATSTDRRTTTPSAVPARRTSVDERQVDALVRASRALVGVAARSLAQLPADLTLPQVRALVVLSTRGPSPAGSLAEVLGVHPSSVTRLVERLERRRLVRRQPGVADRREVVVALTGRGAALVRRMTQARAEVLAQILARLPEPDRSVVVDAFERFADAAGEAGQGAWALGWVVSADDPPAQASSEE